MHKSVDIRDKSMQHDNSNFKIQLFEGQKVRTAWSEEEQLWYFSIIDICWILTESKGSISAAEARAKALDEYRKYQVRTLSPVEQAYIAQLKAAIGRKIKTQK